MRTKKVFYIKLSGLAVEMRSDFDFVERRCKDYLTEERDKPDIVADVTQEQINAERLVNEQALSDGYCEDICLYRAIAEQLPTFDRTVFHGAAIEVEGRGYIFTAPSGTGKTTHISLWRQAFGDKVRIINGDKPILRLDGEQTFVCSSPWMGKEGLGTVSEAPLSAIVLLKRSSENKMTKIAPIECFFDLVKQFYLPRESVSKLKAIEIVDRVLKSVPVYLLECNMSLDAAHLSYKTLIGK